MPRFAVLLAGVIAMTPVLANAQSFQYPNFSTTAGLDLNGSATQNGNKLTLTPANFNQSGSVFSLTPISLGSNASFSTLFSFEILGRGGAGGGADGLTFTVQTVSSSVGGAGGGIGYAGIPNSVGIEFDTFDNGESGGSNHVGINLNGNMSSAASTGQLSPDFDDAGIWYAWVDYNGMANDLQVRWSQSAVRPAVPGLSYAVNLSTVLGSNNAFVGFTSGTGAGYGEHNILSWLFNNEFNAGGAQPLPTTAVPEPSTYALMAAGLAAIFVVRRRRAS